MLQLLFHRGLLSSEREEEEILEEGRGVALGDGDVILSRGVVGDSNLGVVAVELRV